MRVCTLSQRRDRKGVAMKLSKVMREVLVALATPERNATLRRTHIFAGQYGDAFLTERGFPVSYVRDTTIEALVRRKFLVEETETIRAVYYNITEEGRAAVANVEQKENNQ